MAKFKEGDRVRIEFEGDFHEPTDKQCSFERGMEHDNGLIGTVKRIHDPRKGYDTPSYSVHTDEGGEWSWHESALKK